MTNALDGVTLDTKTQKRKILRELGKRTRRWINELNYDGIDFPLSQKHYNKVEKQNSIRINVFGYENGQPFPIHISKETFEDQMNLLLITKNEKKHYVLIKDFNAFMYNQSKHKERKHFCMYCLQCFSSERILANHVNNCLTINGACYIFGLMLADRLNKQTKSGHIDFIN